MRDIRDKEASAIAKARGYKLHPKLAEAEISRLTAALADAEARGRRESLTPLIDRTQSLWRNKFPSATLADHLRKLSQEVQELVEAPDDRGEWADVLLCYLMAAGAKGHSVRDLLMMAGLKIAICEKQDFVPAGDGTYRRVKTPPEQGLANLSDALVADIMSMTDDEIMAEHLRDQLCEDCPPVGYSTDKTRCAPCPRRSSVESAQDEESTQWECPNCGRFEYKYAVNVETGERINFTPECGECGTELGDSALAQSPEDGKQEKV